MFSDSVLDGRTVVVIGAGSGIGRAIAQRTLQAGASVVLAGRNLEKLGKTAAELGSDRVVTRTADLADEDSIRAFAESIGRVDHLVSTASAAANGPVTQLTWEAIDQALAAKVTGPLLLAKHFAPVLESTGSMLFFSGVIAWRPAPQRVVMATTNGALAHLVQALAVELAPVRVNAISPGIVDSGAWDGMGDNKSAFLAGAAGKNPTGTVGTVDELAQAALFALTNGFTTGTVLHVDGGGRLA